MPVQRPYNPNSRRIAEMIQADWAKVGVKAKIVSYEWGEYLSGMRKGEHDSALFGWMSDNGDEAAHENAKAFHDKCENDTVPS